MTEDEYETCSRIVCALSRRMAGNIAPFLEEDLLLEGWMAAIEAARKWDHTKGTTFGSFVYMRVHRSFVNYYRKMNSRRPPYPLISQVEWKDRSVTEAEQRQDQLCLVPSTLPVFDEIGHAVDRLEGRHRYVIRRMFWDGALGKEVANELDLTMARVSQLKQEALRMLKRWI